MMSEAATESNLQTTQHKNDGEKKLAFLEKFAHGKFILYLVSGSCHYVLRLFSFVA